MFSSILTVTNWGNIPGILKHRALVGFSLMESWSIVASRSVPILTVTDRPVIWFQPEYIFFFKSAQLLHRNMFCFTKNNYTSSWRDKHRKWPFWIFLSLAFPLSCFVYKFIIFTGTFIVTHYQYSTLAGWMCKQSKDACRNHVWSSWKQTGTQWGS